MTLQEKMQMKMKIVITHSHLKLLVIEGSMLQRQKGTEIQAEMVAIDRRTPVSTTGTCQQHLTTKAADEEVVEEIWETRHASFKEKKVNNAIFQTENTVYSKRHGKQRTSAELW